MLALRLLQLKTKQNGRTEFLPILQDFVPYRGRCPATIEVTIKKTIKETVEQGKGTGDHLMPLGDWFFILKTRFSRAFSFV